MSKHNIHITGIGGADRFAALFDYTQKVRRNDSVKEE